MRIYGLDFTSAPSERKPITCAVCKLWRDVLQVEAVERYASFEGFTQLLETGGAWIGGLDFPFGQPWKLLTDLSLPLAWEDYVAIIGRKGRQQFEAMLDEYRPLQPAGHKEHERITDSLANSRSPMKLANPSVARMFFEGATRLLDAPVSVLPCRELRGEQRIVVEAYPALMARRFAGSYKSDTAKKQTPERHVARTAIAQGVTGQAMLGIFGLTVRLDDTLAQASIDDASGDTLDAVLCAIQAAWAYQNRTRGFGIPTRNHPVVRAEGWITDPHLIAGRATGQDLT
jgi:hypothetical protein